MTIGLRLADDLGVGVGDTIAIRVPDRARTRAVTVVGTGVGTPLGNERFGSALLVTEAGLERYAEAQRFVDTVVGARRSEDVPDMVDEYSGSYELTVRALPREVDNLRQLERLPGLLGGFLALIGLAALTNAVVLAVRRRGRDLAVLRVVGYTPGQTTGAVLTMGLVAGAIALVVGVPLGIAAGRILWGVVARGVAVEGDALVPLVGVVAVGAGVMLAAARGRGSPGAAGGNAATVRPAARRVIRFRSGR